MRVSVSGAKDKELSKLFKLAAKSFSEKLISPQLSKNVSLKIIIKDKLDAGGYCDFEDSWPYPPRNFVIELDRTKKKIHMFTALAHEMVHLKQFAKSEMKDKLYKRKYVTVWKGEIYEDISYWDCPWEIEAYGLENSLVAKFLTEFDVFKELKQRKEVWFVNRDDLDEEDNMKI
jgi:hypothetical protein